MRCSIRPRVMPDNSVCALTAIAKGLIANVNSSGDRGQPCQVDLSKLKGAEIVLLVRISTVGFGYSS